MDFTAQAFDFCIIDTLRKRVKLLVNLIIILSPCNANYDNIFSNRIAEKRLQLFLHKLKSIVAIGSLARYCK